MEPISIAIVDDNKANRSFISERIVYDETVQVAFVANDGAHFLELMKVNSAALPAAVLMDIEMPGMDGIEAVRHAAVLYPKVKFLMLTVFDSDDKIFEAIKAGASGYLLKDEKVSVILDSLHQLIEFGAAPMSPRIARKALDMLSRASLPEKANVSPSTDFNLTDREKQILKLMVDGQDYKIIAESLFVSPHTVRNHIAHIYEKLHVRNKMQALKLATSSGLL